MLAGAGYLLGTWRGRARERALRAALDERTEKLAVVEHELRRHSAIDAVSGLHTQQYFQEFLEREWRRASRERQFVSLIMAEIDYFNAFNERQGNAEGDACLKVIANVLKPQIHRPSDAIGRYGGAGKFGIVLGGTDSRGAMFLAERLRIAVADLKKPNPASPSLAIFTISLGVAALIPDRQGAWQDIQLIASAERALAQAREAGRNTVMLDPQDSAVHS